MADDQPTRLAAFEWLRQQVELEGDVLQRTVLEQGFVVDGVSVPLIGPQGIWKPRVLPILPLSITTVPKGPYRDSFSYDGHLLYKYRGTDPEHRDNRGLRRCIPGVPLVYFHGILPGRYLAVWPVYVVGDDPAGLTFRVLVDDAVTLTTGASVSADGLTDVRRKYITTTFRQRLHQRSFRERVLQAYRDQCSICRLSHRELLEAAHIIPDSDPGGEPLVRNGISLCKLHHAAFDRLFLGIRPDYVVEIREDLLREADGPMLLHGLQELHGSRIILPGKEGNRPDPTLLEQKYERFRKAG